MGSRPFGASGMGYACLTDQYSSLLQAVAWLASTLCSGSVDDRVVSIGDLSSSGADSLAGGDAQRSTTPGGQNAGSQDAGSPRPQLPGGDSEAAGVAEIAEPPAFTQPVEGPLPPGTTACEPQQRQCVAGERCGQDADCADGLCLSEQSICGCSAESCAAPLQCSVESGQCEAAQSDCPDLDSVLAGDQPLVVGDQALVISTVRFDPSGSGEVTLQNRGSSFLSFAADTFALCSGLASCVALSATRPIQLSFGEELSMEVPNLAPAGGQLAVLALIEEAEQQFLLVENYIAWGTAPIDDDFELVLLNEAPVWQLGARIEVDPNDTGFVCTGPSDEAASYRSCNP